jgi:phage baseplate assembly protein W
MSTRGMSATTGSDLQGIEHLTQSIRDILSTPLGTRVYRRDYGSRIPELVDKPINAALVADMRAAVAEALYKWEPRVRLTRVQVVAVDPGHITMDLDMVFVIDGTPITITGLII